MTLDQLKYFLTTATHQHVGKAAQILRLSPSTVSHAISKLEEEFGQPLFLKHGNQIRLTKSGELLAERARLLLEQAQSVKEDFTHHKAQASLRGVYNIAGTPLLADQLLVEAWTKTQESYPLLQCDLLSVRSATVVEEVLKGRVDLGLCLSPLIHVKLQLETLHKGTLVPVVRKGHPFLRSRKNQINQLADFPLAAARSSEGIDVCAQHPAIEQHDLGIEPTLTFDSYFTALAYVENTDAWTLLPEIITKLTPNQVVALEVPDGWDSSYTLTVVTERSRPPGKVLRELVEHLRAEIRRIEALCGV